MDIIPVYFGQRIHHDFYYDSTTYMMSVVKNLLAPQTPEGAQKPVQLILPNDNDLVGQLSTRKYSMTDDAKIRVESKDAMKSAGCTRPTRPTASSCCACRSNPRGEETLRSERQEAARPAAGKRPHR